MTLLVFIIIISVLILGLIILLLVYWFCRPNRGEQDTQHQVGVYDELNQIKSFLLLKILIWFHQDKIVSIEKSADDLEKEMIKTGFCIEGLQKTVSQLERTVQNSETDRASTQRTQVIEVVLSLLGTYEQ